MQKRISGLRKRWQKKMNENQQRDLEFINNTNEWPSTVLPLVKHLDCGFIIKGQGPILYHKNIFELETGALDLQLVGVETTTFDSFEAIVEAGWEVD